MFGAGGGVRRPLIPRMFLLLVLFLGINGLRRCHGREVAEVTKVGKCMEGERKALLAVRADIGDADKWLSSWGRDHDCCRWEGVFCDHQSGHVVELHLRHPYPGSYGIRAPQSISKVNPSLLNLTSLGYLDLSFNDFGGASIPSVIGCMVNLEYLNLSYAGFAGSVPPQLGSLRNLRTLDLSGLYSSRVENLGWLSHLSHLQYLDMSKVDLSAATDWLREINMLPSLSVLRLGSCRLPNLPAGTLPHVNFTSLSTLDLPENYFNSTWPLWLFNISSLIRLDLGYNLYLHGPIPDGFGNMKRLEVLSLDGNYFEGVIPGSLWTLDRLKVLSLNFFTTVSIELPERMGKLRNLQKLRLGRFAGRLPESLGNLSHLESFWLEFSNIIGGIPQSIGNLVNLKDLLLVSNDINGKIPESLGNLTHLESLVMYYNKFTGGIPKSVGNLVNLKDLSVVNGVPGGFPESLRNLRGLKTLELSAGNISRELLRSIGDFCNLTFLDLGENIGDGAEVYKLIEGLSQCTGGSVLETMYLGGNGFGGHLPDQVGQLSSLKDLVLSGNSIVGSIPASIGLLKYLTTLDLSHNSIVGSIPASIGLLKYLTKLELSDNSIIGSIPTSIGLLKYLTTLDLSENKLSGFVPTSMGKLSNVKYLKLSSNRLEGELSQAHFVNLSRLEYLDLSHNNVNGSIPLSIAQIKSLRVLDLSYNHLSGGIPGCWENTNLIVMKLSHNKLSGPIHSSLGTLPQLTSIHLDKNNFIGVIPSSLKYFVQLVALDFSENKLSGEIPAWLGESLSSLQVLCLRSNMFHGKIPTSLSQLQSLQILDLSCNRLSGTLLLSFHNLSAMVKTEKNYKTLVSSNLTSIPSTYEESIIIKPKGTELEYTRTLSLVTFIDLSGNNLFGHIPKEITSLKGLHFLNLSRNYLEGEIPTTISAMPLLESLDLSFNRLSGNIPSSISTMNFLSIFNVSYNTLSGRIPTGSQLQTFDQSTYIGNPSLCGSPLLRTCPNDVTSQDPIFQASEEDEDKHEAYMIWLYIGMGTGFAVGFWGFFGVLLLLENKRIVYFRFIDSMADELYVMVVVHFARMKVKISSWIQAKFAT